MTDKCKSCDGKMWTVVRNVFKTSGPVPCSKCSVDKTIFQVEKLRGIDIVKRQGKWTERKIRVDCQTCGDKGQIPKGFKDPTAALRESQTPVPCHKCQVSR